MALVPNDRDQMSSSEAGGQAVEAVSSLSMASLTRC